ncbi:ribonuclease D [Bacterioplanes sanyensis]|uniref:Ribonuclease D n=1 Tax=Bacterioplanes sanyensis TaxID=1249553 RepID=A0A222FM73_9GAMM|nr:ribonuclease D [Bacterioplanes sanyensis]ASP39696.1 ribonuclease D [Bacterioplanes sanyensis]
MAQLKIPEPIWLTNNADLAAACQDWCAEAFIAVDTEFVRTKTYFPQAGLIQVASRQGSYLIDPLVIDDWQPLAEVFEHPLVVKVFHACAEDLEVCRLLTGAVPAPLADSQLAAALAGLGGSLGFQKIVKELLRINLPKEETRSNWLQRPLRDEQIRYAVADVHYLHRLYPKLIKLLKSLQRESWLSEECDRLVRQVQVPDDLSGLYRRIKLAWKLRPQEQLVLQQLAVWREQQARASDVPRGQICDDQSLWNIARFKARNRDQLAKAGMRPSIIRDHGKDVLKLVDQALKLDKQYWPKVLDKPLSPLAGQWLKKLRAAAVEKAELLDIPPDLLVKKKMLEALLRSGYPRGPFELPDELSGWRRAEIGDYLVRLLEECSRGETTG